MSTEIENPTAKEESASYTWDALSELLQSFEATMDLNAAKKAYDRICETHESDKLLERFVTDNFIVPFIFKVLAVYVTMHTLVLGDEET